jgi:hypothetical protein|tara:strand:- start:15473 stop:15976 length:504 start_codon:yes stop_codon:yes gene_type:complete
MPNHCYQTVYIQGAGKVVSKLYRYLKTERSDIMPRFCDVISPVPVEISLNTDDRAEYDWRNTNWNTKWDVCDVEIREELDFNEDKTTARFSFYCWTAWAPPIPVWDKLHAMGIEVEADYVDEGGWFEGEYALGKDNCWRPDDEEDDEELGLEDTIDVFKNLMKETMG